MLVGGDIVLDGGSLNAAGGRVELAGVSGNGTVKLNVDSQNLSLSIPNGVPRADISLSNGALVDVRAGVGGSITVNAQNLELKGKSQIVAGIKSGLSTVTATAGDININATDTVSFDNSYARNNVEQTGVSKAGGIEITTGSLEVTNGAVLSASTFGKGDAGSVTITATDGIKFDGINSGAFSTVQPEAEGKAKGVAITTGSLAVTNGAVLSASTSGKGDAGSVNITATDSIKFDGWGSQAGSLVAPEAEGKAGGVTITTDSLAVTNGASLSASTFGKGDAGSINITATDSIKFDGTDKDGYPSGAFSTVQPEAEGKAGGASITTGSLALTNGAQLDASTYGKGDAGSVTITATDAINFDGENNDGSHSGAYSVVNPGAEGKAGGVSITTGSLAVSNGAQVSASTFDTGDAGSITITATGAITFDGSDKEDGINSGAFSTVEPEAKGKAGGVSITTGSLAVSNGAVVSTSTKGTGDAGSVTITATGAITFDGEDKFGHSSGAYSTVEPEAEGKAGGVSITTGSLTVTNGAVLSASTHGKGDAGSVTITATDAINFNGTDKDGYSSGAFSSVQPKAEGNAGGVSITTGSLAVTNGGVLDASTHGKGDAGSVSIFARDAVKFDGVSKDGYSSGAFSGVAPMAEGTAGGVSITTNSLKLTNGAVLDARTLGKGDAGNVSISANTFEASNGGRVTTTTSGESNAGNITFKVKDNITLSGFKTGLFANTTEGSTGNGGSIFIDPIIMTIRDGASIAVGSQGKGTGGDIHLTAGRLTLDQGTISATTRSNNGGNITLNLQDLLLLRNGSLISTTAGLERFGGNGGDITINTPNGFIVAVPSENSDITANAYTGTGGNVKINAFGIYGTQFRAKENPLTSDITASSEFGFNGTVQLNTSDVDPNSGLVNLPTVPVDTQVAQTCQAGGNLAKSSFTITGRGGLPPNPGDALKLMQCK